MQNVRTTTRIEKEGNDYTFHALLKKWNIIATAGEGEDYLNAISEFGQPITHVRFIEHIGLNTYTCTVGVLYCVIQTL